MIKIIPKSNAECYRAFNMKGELTGSLYVGITEPYMNRYFLLANLQPEKGLVDLINGTTYPLSHFPVEVLFNKISADLTVTEYKK